MQKKYNSPKEIKMFQQKMESWNGNVNYIKKFSRKTCHPEIFKKKIQKTAI